MGKRDRVSRSGKLPPEAPTSYAVLRTFVEDSYRVPTTKGVVDMDFVAPTNKDLWSSFSLKKPMWILKRQ